MKHSESIEWNALCEFFNFRFAPLVNKGGLGNEYSTFGDHAKLLFGRAIQRSHGFN